MAAEHPIREPAPAKINLYLHVTGKRDNGYHLLDSLVVFANAGDRLEAVSADTITLDYAGPFVDALPAPEKNLVMRAARQLAELFSVEAGAHMTLHKNLPVASGIGGGSADAAAALRALIRLWHIDPNDARLAKLALSLGADVPVCLMTRPAVMRGIGEDLRLLASFPGLPLVLVNPGVGVATPDVFKARSGEFSASVEWPESATDVNTVIDTLRNTKNDLQAPAVSLAPVIADVLAALENQPGSKLTRMSGSGATCFAIFERDSDAQAAAHAIANAAPGWWVQTASVYGV